MPRRYRTGKTARKRLFREIRKMGALTLVAVLALAVSVTFLIKTINANDGVDREEAKEYLAVAEKYIEDSNYRAARIELKNAVKSDKRWPNIRIVLAQVQLKLFDAAGAKNELLIAKELGTDSSEIDHLLGQAHWLLGEYDDAKVALTNKKIKEENYPESQRILGRVLIETGDVDGSRAAFDRALEKTPDNSMLWTDIGRFRYILGDQKGAIEAVERAVELDKNNIRALEFRGRMVRSQVGLLASLPWFERALEIVPDDIPLLSEYAVTLGDAGRASDMLEVTRDILALERNNGNAFYMQAVIAGRARDYALARRLLLRAGDYQVNRPSGLLLSGIVEYELGNYNKAVGFFRKLLKVQRNHKRGLKLLASGLYRAGEYETAYKAISRYINKYGEDSYSSVVAARSLEAVDKRGEAAKFLDNTIFEGGPKLSLVKEEDDFESLQKNALKSPKSANIVIPYIRALLAKGNVGTALTLAKQLLKNNEGVADAHILVGDIEIRRNKPSAALKHFRNAQAISFEQPTMLRLVDALRRTEEFDEAQEAISFYLSNNPRDLEAQKLMADSYIDSGDAQQAIFWLEAVRDRVGYNDTVLLTKLARSYIAAQRFDDAVKTAKIAYDINRISALTTRMYGFALLRQGEDGTAAVELYKKALKFEPDDADLQAELEEAIALEAFLANEGNIEEVEAVAEGDAASDENNKEKSENKKD